jgi:hypothetical protein
VQKIHRKVELSPREIIQKLVPGMLADVLIITGERTVRVYFLGPIIGSLTRAMRESWKSRCIPQPLWITAG